MTIDIISTTSSGNCSFDQKPDVETRDSPRVKKFSSRDNKLQPAAFVIEPQVKYTNKLYTVNFASYRYN